MDTTVSSDAIAANKYNHLYFAAIQIKLIGNQDFITKNNKLSFIWMDKINLG